ncbi:SAM-dependent methyltransferase, partial [Streptomyces sp. NPDC058953]
MSLQDTERAVAHIFNSAVAASAISAAWELGALDELKSRGALDIGEFAAERRLDLSATTGLFRALAAVDIVERADDKVTPAGNFDETYRTRSFFHWLSRGSGDLFRRMPELLPERNRTGDYYQRDSAAIAVACREISSFCYDPWFDEAIDGLDFEPGVVADLGCGCGERVLQRLRRHPRAHRGG